MQLQQRPKRHTPRGTNRIRNLRQLRNNIPNTNAHRGAVKMITIRNEEEYYKLPRAENKPHHLPLNQAYKAGLYLPEEFWANEICEVLWRRWGIDTGIKQIGYALQVLTRKGFLTRELTQGTYKYKKTARYDVIKNE